MEFPWAAFCTAWHRPIAQNYVERPTETEGKRREASWHRVNRVKEGRERKETKKEEKPRLDGGQEKKEETKKRRKRMVRVPRGEVLGLACPGMASSHSWAFAVRGHHRARATLGFSTSPRCRRRYKTASLKAFVNSERASNRRRVSRIWWVPSNIRTPYADFLAFFLRFVRFSSSFFLFRSTSWIAILWLKILLRINCCSRSISSTWQYLG